VRAVTVAEDRRQGVIAYRRAQFQAAIDKLKILLAP